MMARWKALCAFLILALTAPPLGPAWGEIYRYIDERGVWHFTNVKTDQRYRLYIRGSRYTPTEYIKTHATIIQQASDRFGIDPLFIKAIIKAESNFEEKAVSPKGAQGLMQLMPGTAQDMAVEDPFDPEENIFGGTRYFSMLLRRFQDDKVLALAAYNAGPERVASHGGVPPFPETKAFVERVLRYYDDYLKSGGE